jgi:hypothetical protein
MKSMSKFFIVAFVFSILSYSGFSGKNPSAGNQSIVDRAVGSKDHTTPVIAL